MTPDLLFGLITAGVFYGILYSRGSELFFRIIFSIILSVAIFQFIPEVLITFLTNLVSNAAYAKIGAFIIIGAIAFIALRGIRGGYDYEGAKPVEFAVYAIIGAALVYVVFFSILPGGTLVAGSMLKILTTNVWLAFLAFFIPVALVLKR